MAVKPETAGVGEDVRDARLADRKPLPHLISHLLRGRRGVLASRRRERASGLRLPADGYGAGATTTAVWQPAGNGFAPVAGERGQKRDQLVVPGVIVPDSALDQDAAYEQDTVNGQAAGVAGTVRDDAGRPVPGAVVVGTAMDGREVAREAADGNGNFWLAGFGAGMLTLVVTARGHQPAAAVLRVRAGAIIDREFVLPSIVSPLGAWGSEPRVGESRASWAGADGVQGASEAGRTRGSQGAEVRGVVRAPGGGPVPGILVTAASVAGDIVASAVTGEYGTYRLAGLGGGDHVLVAGGHAPASAAVRVGAGSTATVTMRIGSEPPGPPVERIFEYCSQPLALWRDRLSVRVRCAGRAGAGERAPESCPPS